MTTAFEHRWNVTFQAAKPDLIESGTVVLQKSLEKVVPSPLPLPLPAAYLLHPTSGDLEVLADLLQAAYALPDESIPALRQRLHNYFSAGDSRPMLESSWMCFHNGRLVSACLVSMPRGESVPQITDLVTVVPWQNHGLATVLLQKTLHALVENGHDSVQLLCYSADHGRIKKLEQFGFTPADH